MSNYSQSFFNENNQNASWFKIFQIIPKGSKVLDIGCSSGNFGQVLIKRKGCLVDGIEPNVQDAKVASKKLHKVWRLNIEVDELNPLPHNYYDFIFFGDVIEHLAHPVKTLERVKPLLNKRGQIAFSIPNMGHIGVRLSVLKGSFEYTETGLTDKTHFHFYTQNEVGRVFGEAGYQINNFDFVEKDYPKELIKKELNTLGLVPRQLFYQMANKSGASAFQFVGTARPSAKVTKKLKQFGPIDLFEKFHQDTKNNYELEIKRLKKELLEQRKIVKHKTEHPYRSLAGHLSKKLLRR